MSVEVYAQEEQVTVGVPSMVSVEEAEHVTELAEKAFTNSQNAVNTANSASETASAAHTAAINASTAANNATNAANNAQTAAQNHSTNKNNPHGVTAEQVGARPNTWMPTAFDVGATPASHATDKTNPHGVTAAQIGAATTADVNAAVKKAAPRNLLDNSDFRNPVNQRGQTSYNGAVYGIDRWVGDNADSNATITENGLIVTGGPYLTQILEKKYVGKTLTICAKDVNGGIAVATCTVQQASGYAWLCTNTSETKTFVGILQTDTGVLRANITNHAGIAIEWVALYEGEYTAETLPEYQPKGYGVELAECRRYYQRYGGEAYTKFGFGVAVSASNARVLMPILPMRITKPSCNSVGVFALDPGDNIFEVAQINLDEPSYGGLYACLSVSISGDQLTPRNVVLLQAYNSASSYIELSADL